MIVAIVQARMESKRLPGKVMQEVLGKPLISYLLGRLSRSKQVDKIVLATSINESNDVLCNYVEFLGYSVFRGSETDVLDRYYQSALKYKAKTIVRVTGDCPLIDCGICDRLIDFYEHQKADYAGLASEFAEGLDCEVFSFESLEKANSNANLRSEREHVTVYIKKHPEFFNNKYIGNIDDDSCYRITVDNEEDFYVVKAIIEHFKANPAISWLSVRDFLKKHPDIMAKNSYIERNEGLRMSIEQDKKL